MISICVITEESSLGGIVSGAKSLGETTAIVVGSEELANKVATSGVDSIKFIESELPEAKAEKVSELVCELSPKVVFTNSSPSARAIAGKVANELDSVIVPGVVNVTLENDFVVVEQEALSGRVLDTLVSKKPVIGFFAGEDVELTQNTPVEIEKIDSDGYGMSVEVSSNGSSSSGLSDASRVVSIGRGVKSKDDLSIIESFATKMDAQIGCSMPVADDLSWLPKDCYVGRSGQQISPRVYFTVGISGAPQHLEGVRGAKVIVAINNDPEARIFKSADYGIVGDLYEIIPALEKALD